MRRIIVIVLVPIIVLVSGCGKQDKEILANIGRKITSKFESASSPTRKKLEMGIQAMRGRSWNLQFKIRCCLGFVRIKI